MVGQTEDNINNIDTHVPSTSFMSYLSSTVGVLVTFPTSSFGFSLGFALPKSGIFVLVFCSACFVECGGGGVGVSVSLLVMAAGPPALARSDLSWCSWSVLDCCSFHSADNCPGLHCHCTAQRVNNLTRNISIKMTSLLRLSLSGPGYLSSSYRISCLTSV